MEAAIKVFIVSLAALAISSHVMLHDLCHIHK